MATPTAAKWPFADLDLPPRDHLYASACWLLSRSPSLQHLARRARVVGIDEDGDLEVDLDALADAINDLDAHRAAWKDYEYLHPAPADDALYDDWVEAGPKNPNPRATAIGPMSRTEQARLRLLATLSQTRVAFRVDDTSGFDAGGKLLKEDWAMIFCRL